MKRILTLCRQCIDLFRFGGYRISVSREKEEKKKCDYCKKEDYCRKVRIDGKSDE